MIRVMRSAHAQALHPGDREQRGVDHAGSEFRQARVDIAAQRHDAQIGAGMQDLRVAARRRCADHGARRQRREARRLRREERVARILARQMADQRQPLRQQARQVLGGMHRAVDGAGEQRLLELLGEQSLAADRGQRAIVAAGRRWSGSSPSRSHRQRRARHVPRRAAPAAPPPGRAPMRCRACRYAGRAVTCPFFRRWTGAREASTAPASLPRHRPAANFARCWCWASRRAATRRRQRW